MKLSAGAFGKALAVPLAAIAVAALAVAVVALWKDRSAASLLWFSAWLGLMTFMARREARGAAFWPTLVLTLAFAALLRWQGLDLVDGVSLRADPMNYANLARGLLAGNGLIVDDWRYGEGLRAHWPPLYPIALAGWWGMFGDGAIATLAMQTVLALATAWLLFDCARASGSAPAGRIAALSFLTYPAYALAVYPHKEGLLLLIVVAMLRLAIAWLDRPKLWHCAALGALWGLLALGQPSWALMPVAVALVLAALRGVRPVVALGLVAAPALIAVLAPWWLRNWVLFHAFVPLTTAGGYTFWVALGEHAPAFPVDLFSVPEPRRAAVMTTLSLDAIAAQPFAYVRTVLVNAAKAFAYEEGTIGALRSAVPTIAPGPRGAMTFFVQAGWTALLAVSAWAAARGRAPVFLTGVAIAMLVALGGINIWIEFGERHRQVLTPLLMLIAAFAVAPQALPTTLSGRSLPKTR